jgi:hypothetical protein
MGHNAIRRLRKGAALMRDDVKEILARPTCSVEELRKIIPGSKPDL